MRTGSGLAVLCIGQFFLLASGFSYSLVIQYPPCALQHWAIFSMASSSITVTVKVSPVLFRLVSLLEWLAKNGLVSEETALKLGGFLVDYIVPQLITVYHPKLSRVKNAHKAPKVQD